MANRVIEPCVLLVEGKDDVGFFEALLKKLGITQIQVTSIEGVDNLELELGLLKKDPNFKNMGKVLGIVRDADDDPQKAFAYVQNALASTGFTDIPDAPLQTSGTNPALAVLILDNNLEDICWKVFQNDPLANCVDQHFECLEQTGIPLRNSLTLKAKLRVLFASIAVDANRRDDKVWWLTVAYEKDWWPWSDPVFDDAKRFLHLVTSSIES